MRRQVTRNDSLVERDVKHSLKADVDVPEEEIRVTVYDGTVTLEGTVMAEWQKAAAEKCARQVTGIRAVNDLIEVAPVIVGKG